jgi:hypothetical protein
MESGDPIAIGLTVYRHFEHAGTIIPFSIIEMRVEICLDHQDLQLFDYNKEYYFETDS